MSRVRIVSDGTAVGTSITVDGEPITECVRSVTWSIDDPLGFATATLELEGVEVDVTGDAEASPP